MSSNSTVDVSPVHTRFGFVSANVWGVSHTVFFFQAEAGIRDGTVTGVQTCALPISGGEVGPPRDPDGHGSGRLLSVAGVPALRSRRSYLAEPRSVRALDGPRLDAALFDARARGSQGGERQVRAAGPARPDARRHQALPSARQ